MNTVVRCKACGSEERVNFGYCLTHGWPRCGDHQMQLIEVDEEAIDADMGKMLAPIAETIQRVVQHQRTGGNDQP